MGSHEEQVEGGNDVPLTVPDNKDVVQQPSQKKILTPTDAEFHRYSELLNGFFEKLSKWQDIFGEYAEPSKNRGLILSSYYQSSYEFERELHFNVDVQSAFHVLETPYGLKRASPPPFLTPKTPHKVFSASMDSAHERTSLFNATAIKIYFSQRLTDFEKQLLVDLNGVKPTGVEVVVCDIPDRLALKYLEVHAELPYDPSQPTDQNVRYELAQGYFKITRGYESIYHNHQPMSDAYAIHLFNTIDLLIPQANAQLPEPTGEGE